MNYGNINLEDGTEVPNTFMVKVEHFYIVSAGEIDEVEEMTEDDLRVYLEDELTKSVPHFVEWNQVAGGAVKLAQIKVKGYKSVNNKSILK